MNQKLVVHSYPRHACREGSSVWWMKDLLLIQPHPFAFPSFPCLWLWQLFGSVGKNLHWDCKAVPWTRVVCSTPVKSSSLTRELEGMLIRLKAGELRWWTGGTGTVPVRGHSWHQQLHENTETSFADKVSYMDRIVGTRTAVSPLGDSAWDWWITLHQRMPGLSV